MNGIIKKEEYLHDLSIKKIPRPPNAFMLYANENRKIMAQTYPTDSNKDISKRLGRCWQALQLDEKKKFFEKAKAIDIEHKRKYPNYVYNPKEARLRKAMRDATRDRSIGTSPMLPRPNARLPSHDWIQPRHQDDQLMMAPLGGMRGTLEPTTCSFPISSPGNNQFMPPIAGYGKLDSPMTPNSASLHSNYMQQSPLAQLQQQTEMWHSYQENMRPRSSIGGNHFMMQEMSPYHHQDDVQDVPTNLMIEKPSTPVTRPMSTSTTVSSTPPHMNEENIPPSNKAATPAMSAATFTPVKENDLRQPIESNNLQQNDSFISSFAENVIAANPFEKVEATAGNMKKVNTSMNVEHCKVSEDFLKNICFPGFCSEFSDGSAKNDKNVFTEKSFENLPDCSVLNITTNDGISFPYVTFSPPKTDQSIFLDLMDVNAEPKLIPTDVGYIPILDNDFILTNLETVTNLK